MANKVTRVETQGFFGTLMESLKKVVSGFAILMLAFPLLLWNECRSVQTAKSLDEGAGLVVSIESDTVNKANDGKLVHTSGEVKTDETLKDRSYGVTAKALRLSSSVEMYQWKETKKEEKKGDKKITTFTYDTSWSSSLSNSDSFEEPIGHRNPSSIPEDGSVVTRNATMGGFQLIEDQVQKMTNWEDLAIDDKLARKAGGTVDAGRLYIANGGGSPKSPAVGDIRVRFQTVMPGPYSVVGKQVRSTFEAYPTEAGDKLLLVQSGTVSAEGMFQAAQDANVMMTWMLRFMGFFMMFAGLGLIFGPIKVVADKVPFLGSLISGGVTIVAFLLAAFLWLFTIAISWIFARPLVGIVLMVLAFGSLAGLIVLAMKAKGKVSAAAA